MDTPSEKVSIDKETGTTNVPDISTKISVVVIDEEGQVPQLSETVILASSDKSGGEPDRMNETEEATQESKIVEPIFSEEIGTEFEKIERSGKIIAEEMELDLRNEKECPSVIGSEQVTLTEEILVTSEIAKQDTVEIKLEEASKYASSVKQEPSEATISEQIDVPTGYKSTPGRKRKAKSHGNTRPPSTRDLRSVIIPNGVGINLCEIAGINWNSLTYAMTEMIHKIIYGRVAQADAMVENIKLFHGYEFQFNSFEYNRKLASLTVLSFSDIRAVATFFNLGSSGRKDEVVLRIALFLLNPAEMTEQQPPKLKNSSKRSLKHTRSPLKTVKLAAEAFGSQYLIPIKEKKTKSKPLVSPIQPGRRESSSDDICVPSTSGEYPLKSRRKVPRAASQKHVQYSELSTSSNSSSSGDESAYQHKSKRTPARKRSSKLNKEHSALSSTPRTSAHSSTRAVSRSSTRSASRHTKSLLCTSTPRASDVSAVATLHESKVSSIKKEGQECKTVGEVHVESEYPPSVETTDSADKTALKQVDAAMESGGIKVTDKGEVHVEPEYRPSVEATDSADKTALKQTDAAMESGGIKVTGIGEVHVEPEYPPSVEAINSADKTALKQADAAMESGGIKVTGIGEVHVDPEYPPSVEATDSADKTALKQADAAMESGGIKVTGNVLKESDIAMEVPVTVSNQSAAAIEVVGAVLKPSNVVTGITDSAESESTIPITTADVIDEAIAGE